MTFKADQILGLDAFDSNLGAEESITPLITLKGNSLRATLSPRSEQGITFSLPYCCQSNDGKFVERLTVSVILGFVCLIGFVRIVSWTI